MTTVTFVSPATNSTFYLLADNTTVTSLVNSITDECTVSVFSTTTPAPYNASADSSHPRPEQVIQYYRASSVALALEGYNDTSALSENQTAPDVPLPSWVDHTMLGCLNKTIGDQVPLVNDASLHAGNPVLALFVMLVSMMLLL